MSAKLYQKHFIRCPRWNDQYSGTVSGDKVTYIHIYAHHPNVCPELHSFGIPRYDTQQQPPHTPGSAWLTFRHLCIVLPCLALPCLASPLWPPLLFPVPVGCRLLAFSRNPPPPSRSFRWTRTWICSTRRSSAAGQGPRKGWPSAVTSSTSTTLAQSTSTRAVGCSSGTSCSSRCRCVLPTLHIFSFFGWRLCWCPWPSLLFPLASHCESHRRGQNRLSF